MRGRFSLADSPKARRLSFCLIVLAGFAGCGASCNKPTPDATGTPAEEGAVVELPGVDTGSLVLTEKRLFTKVVHDTSSPCGDPVTLEVCVKENRACKSCLPAARAVAKMVSKGEGEKEIREWLENRFDDKSVKQIEIGQSPSLGPAQAPLTIIEFADFECPHCGMAAPILHAAIEDPEFKPKTRFVFKNYPLPSHEHADPAARAAVAAQNQGKFWEMHDQLFTHQETLTNQDIEGFAKKLGLDIEKFKTDWASNETKDRVAKDKTLGSNVGVQGTPSVFINGRKFAQYGHGDFAEQLKEWMRLELAVMAPAAGASGSAPAPSMSVAPSAAPSMSVAPSASTSAKPKGSK
ncbi:MAG: DsbA family protein [Polyangiales bacterium]